MSNDIGDPGHGHSPAAWTTVVIALVAISFGTLFFFLEMPLLVWLSVVLLVIAGIVGLVMTKAGYGVGGSKTTAKQH
ncbi:DUF6704 family protein [Microbacterium dauci]|jgi:hypothetical protein|uniref:HGxxPAAW family protein n=1 Tax=Microbacterium dauci TaxID=3048008 RepID=A0ABT6ZC34_9MICO|nr:DUF6704 family protein [Microbacterium sp. LX3-4]MDJ1113725.1 HGxxPAAW family protein [Microbacterium sp. LX3-4]